MKAKFITIILASVMFEYAFVQEFFKVDEICYKIEKNNNNRISVCNKDGSTGECKDNYQQKKIIIPDSVEYNGIKYPVTRFEVRSFSNCKNLDTIIISNNVEVLNVNAFENCTNLKYIEISKKVKKINLNCFYNCTSLESIILPASVTEFADKIFTGCTNLKNIYILCNIPKISKNAFEKFDANNCNFWILKAYKQQYNQKFIYKHRIKTIDNITSESDITFPQSFENTLTPLTFSIEQDKGCNFDISPEAEYIATKGLEIQKKVDTTRYHFFSIPFDCMVEDISSTTGLSIQDYGKYWLVMSYDSEGFANSREINWKSLKATDTIISGKGYIIGISNDIDRKYLDKDGQVTMIFPSKTSISLKNSNGKSSEIPTPLSDVKVNIYPSPHKAQQNWNLIGSNLLHSVNNISIKVNNKNINYISIPNSDGKTYTQTETNIAKLNSFAAYFIQADEAGTLDIKYNTTDKRLNINEDKRIVIALCDSTGQTDKTTLLLNDLYTEDYEYNHDLLKLESADNAQIYSITNDTHLCYCAVPTSSINNFVEINVNIPDKQEYTLSLNQNDIDDRDIILLDRYLNTTINLSKQNYTFKKTEGTITNRFAIYCEKRDTLTNITENKIKDIEIIIHNGIIEIKNIEPEAEMTLYSIDGRLIKKAKTSAKIENIPNGNYILQINNDKQKTYKINVH